MPDSYAAASSHRDVRAAWQALAGRVRRTLAETDGNAAPRLVRLEGPAGGALDPLGWLRAQRRTEAGSRLYWRDRRSAEAVAALGCADVMAHAGPLDGADGAHRPAGLAEAGPAVRYYGGARFDPARAASGGWEAFGAYRFVLPRFEVVRRASGEARLACNLVLPRDAAHANGLAQQMSRLAVAEALPPEVLPPLQARTDEPDRAGWRRRVEWALGAFARGPLEKVVLARQTTLRFVEAPDPVALLAHLQNATPGCFHFLVEPEHGGAVFLGASPERLFRLREGRLQSEAVAGTRPRGASAGTDAELLGELLESDKDRREHAVVQSAVRRRLEALCTGVEADEDPSALTLARGRHLYARVQGTLRPGVTALDALRTLHPTPAVGGAPASAALDAIRAQEPFDRGWYAGPVGWIGAEEAEFAVGIRSGLLAGWRLDLFAGAGLVEGSIPEDEWDEVEQKIGDFLGVLRAGRTIDERR